MTDKTQLTPEALRVREAIGALGKIYPVMRWLYFDDWRQPGGGNHRPRQNGRPRGKTFKCSATCRRTNFAIALSTTSPSVPAGWDKPPMTLCWKRSPRFCMPRLKCGMPLPPPPKGRLKEYHDFMLRTAKGGGRRKGLWATPSRLPPSLISTFRKKAGGYGGGCPVGSTGTCIAPFPKDRERGEFFHGGRACPRMRGQSLYLWVWETPAEGEPEDKRFLFASVY